MLNFSYCNPSRIIFGRGQIAELAKLVPAAGKILMVYGGGSIKRNGVYEQVKQALAGHAVHEFSGIEPNPHYETCIKAIELCRAEKIDFLLAVGGGSVIDAVKFIAAGALFEGADPWEIFTGTQIKQALPLGVVLTLPATGSEMNTFSVVTRAATKDKLAFSNPAVYPKFSILDPETTFTLPPRQTGNGVVDSFAHVMEQYMTYDVNAPLQERLAESILQTLIENGPKALANPADYDARASLMLCATMAFNGLIACGVPQDWATHKIGHELTAKYGLDHAQTLAAVMPALLRHQRAAKRGRLLQYAARVWGLADGAEEERISQAIEKTEEFFRAMGVKTRLSEYGVAEGLEEIPQRLSDHGLSKLGEHKAIGAAEVAEILKMCA